MNQGHDTPFSKVWRPRLADPRDRVLRCRRKRMAFPPKWTLLGLEPWEHEDGCECVNCDGHRGLMP